MVDASPSGGKNTFVITMSPVESVWEPISDKLLRTPDPQSRMYRTTLPFTPEWQSQAQQPLPIARSLNSLDESVNEAEGLLADVAVVAADNMASRRSILSIFSIRLSERISSTSCIEAVKLRLEYGESGPPIK